MHLLLAETKFVPMTCQQTPCDRCGETNSVHKCHKAPRRIASLLLRLLFVITCEEYRLLKSSSEQCNLAGIRKQKNLLVDMANAGPPAVKVGEFLEELA